MATKQANIQKAKNLWNIIKQNFAYLNNKMNTDYYTKAEIDAMIAQIKSSDYLVIN